VSDVSQSSRKFSTQIPLNLISNIAYFLVNVVIGILLVPYFLSTLGIAAYGLIPLATSITGYVTIVIDSLNTSVSRFLTVDLHHEDYKAANRTFNTAFFGLSIIIVCMIPVAIVVSWLIPALFHVPQGQDTGMTLLFIGVCMSFFIRAWSGNYTVQLFAYNRIDLQNIVNLTNVVVQTGLIVLFFFFFGPHIALIGGAYLIGAIVASVVSIILAKRICPHLRVSFHSFDRSKVRDIFSMSWWVVINQIGSLLFLQIDLIVVNLIFGATATGQYAIAFQWSNLLRSIASVLAFVLTPVVLIYYARNQTASLIRVSKSAVKLMGLSMALPIGLVCGFAPQLLSIWVGPKFAFLSLLMIILTVHLVINLAVLPLFAINVAYNEVRVPGIVTLIMGIGNFSLAIILSMYSGLGYYGVAIAGAIVLTMKNVFFIPWYATKILNINVHTFTRSMMPGILALAFVWILSVMLRTFFPVVKLLNLIIAGSVISLIYLIVTWIFILSLFERNILLVHLPEKIKRFVNAIPCYCKDR
jgi:membrane protein EpsK